MPVITPTPTPQTLRVVDSNPEGLSHAPTCDESRPASIITVGGFGQLPASTSVGSGQTVTLSASTGLRNGQVIQSVATNPQALGYVSLAAVGDNQTVRTIALEGVSPTLETVRNGRYPYSRPLVLAARAHPDDLAAVFVEFGQSPEIHDLLARHGFVPRQP